MYKGSSAPKYFKNETEAFIHLLDGQDPHRDVIGYYGSFKIKDNFYLILEYADKGDLESYFRNVEPPTIARDITCFWKGFLRLIYGLIKIHKIDPRDPDHLQNLIG